MREYHVDRRTGAIHLEKPSRRAVLGPLVMIPAVLVAVAGFRATAQELPQDQLGVALTPPRVPGPHPAGDYTQEDALRLLERLAFYGKDRRPRCRLRATVQLKREAYVRVLKTSKALKQSPRQLYNTILNLPVDPDAEPMEAVVVLDDDGLEPRPECQPDHIAELRELAGLEPLPPPPTRAEPGDVEWVPPRYCSLPLIRRIPRGSLVRIGRENPGASTVERWELLKQEPEDPNLPPRLFALRVTDEGQWIPPACEYPPPEGRWVSRIEDAEFDAQEDGRGLWAED